MSNDLERFERALHGLSIKDVWEMRRAIVGPADMRTEEAKAGLAVLRSGEREPTPKELAAMELVVRLMRPSLLSQSQQIEDLPDESAGFADWETFRSEVRTKLYTIGRIDNAEGRGIGTGFLISEKLLVTNKHVLDQLTGGIRKLERGQAKVYFRQEFRSLPDEAPFDVVKVTAIHDSLDLCILEIDPVPLDVDRQLLRISVTNATAGDDVAVLGYPQRNTSLDPLFAPAIFGNRFGVKRVAPGEVVSVNIESHQLFHDSSTLNGNSGSPVISMATGDVVGVHAAGFFLLRNESVASSALDPFFRPYI